MSVGPLQEYTTVLCGHLTITLVDGEGNIKAIRRNHNIVSSYAKALLAHSWFSAPATAIPATARYVWVGSAMSATPTLSMVIAFSGNPGGIASAVNLTNNPTTLTYSWHNDVQWSMNGTMCFVGYGGYSSIDCAALCWNPTCTAASISLTQWFAQACFTDLAINSVDKLSFNWAFSLSTTASTAV
jgi:hypothetical protein